MSNTTIQIKRSSTTPVPIDGSLTAGELAYSYKSDTLFMGNVFSNTVIAIGGRALWNKANTIHDAANNALFIANLAFDRANSASGGSSAVDAYNQANTAYAKANLVFDAANAAAALATSANAYTTNRVLYVANLAFDRANTAVAADAASNAYATGVILYTANLAFGAANAANAYAKNSVLYTANLAFDKANSANIVASQAFDKANAALPQSGGTINGDLQVVGNVSVIGSRFIVNTTAMNVVDPMLFLAAGNRTSDITDIGVVANYMNGGGANVSTGLYRDAGTKEWYVFEGYTSPLDANNHIDPAANNFTISMLNTNIRTSNIWLNGQNLESRVAGSYDAANAAAAAVASANAFSVGRVLYVANLAYGAANTAAAAAASANAYTTNRVLYVANLAFDMANTANVNASNASYFLTGIVKVPFGGTGAVSFTDKGVIYGGGTSALQVTAAGTEGQVLQASSVGVPGFGMLDGGSF